MQRSDPNIAVERLIQFNEYLNRFMPPPPINRVEVNDKDTVVLVFVAVSLFEEVEYRVVLKFVGTDILVCSKNASLAFAVASVLRLIGGKPSLPVCVDGGVCVYMAADTDTAIKLSMTSRVVGLEELPAPALVGFLAKGVGPCSSDVVLPGNQFGYGNCILRYSGELDLVSILTQLYTNYVEQVRREAR